MGNDIIPAFDYLTATVSSGRLKISIRTTTHDGAGVLPPCIKP
ncbi:hypothetical protein NEIELOOT_00272 [Neisseria elongata subsp. glycolytica ATCC 29315]|uniref:Uncharacterized protein n=1 Tax=Neisseria elongata subsp. glycolytica ATCC 29315 TaxID=546263 RepID=D4DMK4_NEIEG|nr:hypothetical protein NEIELOOT_00272 [Neisseria elongata subsp. glycolytica ATCC 29315]